MKKVFTLFITIIIFGIILFLYVLKTKTQPGCGIIDEPEPFCGTQNYTLIQSEGRSLFNMNCAACHKLQKNMTGPALKDIGKKYDSTIIVKYLKGDKSLIPTKNFNTDCVVFKHLKEEEVFKILNYTDY